VVDNIIYGDPRVVDRAAKLLEELLMTFNVDLENENFNATPERVATFLGSGC